MIEPFFQAVDRHFGFLEAAGFRKGHRQTFNLFDNAEVIFEGPCCRMRVGRDRGFVSVDFAALIAPKEDWFDLGTVVYLLSGHRDRSYEYMVPSGTREERTEWQLSRLATITAQYLHEACALFASASYHIIRQELIDAFHQRVGR